MGDQFKSGQRTANKELDSIASRLTSMVPPAPLALMLTETCPILPGPTCSVRLMGDQVESDQRTANKELDSIASRLTTLLTTMNESPAIRCVEQMHITSFSMIVSVNSAAACTSRVHCAFTSLIPGLWNVSLSSGALRG